MSQESVQSFMARRCVQFQTDYTYVDDVSTLIREVLVKVGHIVLKLQAIL